MKELEKEVKWAGANLDRQLDRTGSISEISFIHLANTQWEVFYFYLFLDSITSQPPFSCDKTGKQLPLKTSEEDKEDKHEAPAKLAAAEEIKLCIRNWLHFHIKGK